MRGAGLPGPVFEELAGFFRVTLMNGTRVPGAPLNRRQLQALQRLREDRTITAKAYGAMTGVSNPVAVSDLNNMVERGILRKVGRTRGAYYELAGDHLVG